MDDQYTLRDKKNVEFDSLALSKQLMVGNLPQQVFQSQRY